MIDLSHKPLKIGHIEMLAYPFDDGVRLVFQFAFKHTRLVSVTFKGAQSATVLPEQETLFANLRRAFMLLPGPGRAMQTAEGPRPTAKVICQQKGRVLFDLGAPSYSMSPVFDVTWQNAEQTFPWLGDGWIYQQDRERPGWEPAIGELLVALQGAGDGIIDMEKPLFRRRVKTPADAAF